MNPAVRMFLAAGCVALSAGVAFGLVEQIARYLFDRVDDPPGRDETAPPNDAP